MAFCLFHSLSVQNSFCPQRYVMMTRASVRVRVWTWEWHMMHTHIHTFSGCNLRKLSELNYLLINKVSQWFSKPFTESVPLPHSQTSLCCSKNKIPPVKLSALRFGAFKVEASEKLERVARHAHSGKVDTFKTTLEIWGRSKFEQRCTQESQLKMQIERAEHFSFTGKRLRHSSEKPNCWLGRGVCMLKVKEEGPCEWSTWRWECTKPALFL